MAKAQVKVVTRTADEKKNPGRIEHSFSKMQEFKSSMFKLMPSPVVKRIGLSNHPDENPQDFYPFEHTHVFRTFDSDGKQLHQSAAIGGHFHIITLKPQGAGEENLVPEIESISPPMVMTVKKIKGRRQPVATPLNDYDFHTHDVEYIRTDLVQARKHNVVAAMVEAQEAQKGAPPAGAGEM